MGGAKGWANDTFESPGSNQLRLSPHDNATRPHPTRHTQDVTQDVGHTAAADRGATRMVTSAVPAAPGGAPRALVICPGRGSYNATELSSLNRLPSPMDWQPLIAQADEACAAAGLRTVTDLDAATAFSRKEHLEPAHASVLSYAIAAADYAAQIGAMAADGASGVARESQWHPVGVCGNSLGWYTAVQVSGALSFREGLHIVLTTGLHQRRASQRGGQLVYPTMGEGWDESRDLSAALESALEQANTVGYAALSIELGGSAVLAADDEGLEVLRAALPPVQRGRIKFPLVLPGHSAFHSPLMADMAEVLTSAVPAFAEAPSLPLVDGTGRVWPAGSACDLSSLREYTIGEQVLTPYLFGRSLEAAIEAVDPDVLVLLGPGSSLGGAVGQTLSRMKWRGIDGKASFAAVQASQRPALISHSPKGQ